MLQGAVDLPTAVGVCDVPLFRVMVRIRADRQSNPILILHQEHTPTFDYATAAQWFQVNPYPPQADWERQQGDLIQRIGQEQAQASEAIRQHWALRNQGKN